MSAVYFAKFGEFVKIGFASNPRKRMEEIGRGRGVKYPADFDYSAPGELIFVLPFCRMRDERNMQLLFARHWVVGEWFRWSPEFRYQMQTMQFVTHDVRLKHLRAARKALGLSGAAVKEWHWGKQTQELLAEAAERREAVRAERGAA